MKILQNFSNFNLEDIPILEFNLNLEILDLSHNPLINLKKLPYLNKFN